MVWSFARKITIDHTKCGSADSSSFPVLFSGTYAGSGTAPDLRTVANGGAIRNTVSSNGVTIPADLAFYSDVGLTTALPFEIATYTASSGLIEAWVQVPTLSASSDVSFYVAYGDAGATTDRSGFGSGTKPWDANFVGVYHLASVANLIDSSGNVSAATNHSATNGAAQIAQGASFASQYIDCGNNPAQDVTNAFSMSCWVNLASLASQMSPIAKGLLTGSNSWFISYNPANGATTKLYFAIVNGSQANYTTDPVISTWYHLYATGTANSSNVDIRSYQNGALKTTLTNQAAITSTSGQIMTIGSYSDRSAFVLPWNGSIDEFRISNTPRSASWVLAEYNNQNSPSTFYAITVHNLVKTINGLARASVKTVGGIPIASVKTIESIS